MIFREFFEHIGAQHITFDIFFRFVVDRDAAVGVQVLFVGVIKLLQRHVFAYRGGYCSRRHDLLGTHLAQFQETADGFCFLGLEHAFFHAHVHHGLHFLATHGELGFLAAHHARHQFRKQHQGVGNNNEYADDARRAQRHFAPVGGAHHLRYDF